MRNFGRRGGVNAMLLWVLHLQGSESGCGNQLLGLASFSSQPSGSALNACTISIERAQAFDGDANVSGLASASSWCDCRVGLFYIYFYSASGNHRKGQRVM